MPSTLCSHAFDNDELRKLQQQAQLASGMANSLNAISSELSPEAIKSIKNFGQQLECYLVNFEHSELGRAMAQSAEMAAQIANRLGALTPPIELSSVIKPEYLEGVRALVDFANRIAPVKDIIDQRQIPSLEALADAIEGVPNEAIADRIEKTFPLKAPDAVENDTTTISSFKASDFLLTLAAILEIWSNLVGIGLLPKALLATDLLNDLSSKVESMIRECQETNREQKDLSNNRILKDCPPEINGDEAPEDLTHNRPLHEPTSTLI